MLIPALRKELLLQWRSRSQFVAVFVFGATSLLLFSFEGEGETIVMATHQWERGSALADVSMVLDGGRVVE